MVRDVTAAFYTRLDGVTQLDPADATMVADDSPQYRTTRLWLESTFRKTAVPIADLSLTVAARGLADPLTCQPVCRTPRAGSGQPATPRPARRRGWPGQDAGDWHDPLRARPRRRRAERILIITPRHILEQMQQELWTRFALPSCA